MEMKGKNVFKWCSYFREWINVRFNKFIFLWYFSILGIKGIFREKS